MLLAHIVPGYFVAYYTKSYWQQNSNQQSCALWLMAIGSTIAPDSDVIYNIIGRGFSNHSLLWTHSLFVHAGIGLMWYWLYRIKRWPFLQMLIGRMALGGLSHLLLDVISHGTPLLYPVSLIVFGWPPQCVVEGGLWAYLTDPIFLFEPLLLGLAVTHWGWHNITLKQTRVLSLIVIIGFLVLFIGCYLDFLPSLQHMTSRLME